MKAHDVQPPPKAPKKSTTQLPWAVCRRCGLIMLKNAATARAARAACPGKEDDPPA